MIIDLILDRKDDDENGYGDNYKPHDFYMDCMGYNSIFCGIADSILGAMDYGTNKDVQRALCAYIDKNEYNPEIKEYIVTKQWI